MGGPLYGGPLEPLSSGGGRARSIIPSTTLGDWADPNSVLSAVSVSGGRVTLTMANPAAARDLPTTGASWVTTLTDLTGGAVASIDNAPLRQLFLNFLTGTSVPADCWVGLALINAATAAGATVGLGCVAQGNGTGIRASIHYYAAGWVLAGAATHSANTRYVTADTRSSSSPATTGSGYTGIAADSAGANITTASSANSTAIAIAPSTHVVLSCGWVAGSGAGGAQIVVRPSALIGAFDHIPGAS